MRAFAPLMLLAALPAAANAQNLVTNGDFEAGNSGFTSQYAFSPGSNSSEGQYTVRNDPFPWNPFFLSRGDHTTGSGLMFVGNGAPVAGQIVWQSGPIGISALTTYFFEAFTMNVCCGPNYTGLNSDPNFTFRISLDGGAATDLATLTIPSNQSGVWFGLSTSFDSGSASSVQLSLVNANTTQAGNDFAVDDIILSTRSVVNAVPEPSTWALLILGFGAVGSAMRARRARGLVPA